MASRVRWRNRDGVGTLWRVVGQGHQLGLERQGDTLQHGHEQVSLVLEMPVDSATRQTSGLGDLGQ